MESFESVFIQATGFVIIFIETVVLAVIFGATLMAVLRMVGLVSIPSSRRMEQSRKIWLGYARWLVAGLTLQIGADILESSIAPTWQAVAQLGAIAVIRTFLNYFLERDIREISDSASRNTQDL